MPISTLADREMLYRDTSFRRQVKMAAADFAQQIARLPLADPSLTTDPQRRRHRIRQRWAQQFAADPERWVDQMCLYLASALPSAQGVGNSGTGPFVVTDANLVAIIAAAVDAVASTELGYPTESLTGLSA
jgi:hypothetical protein